MVTDRGLPYMFRLCGRDDDQAPAAAKFLKEQLKAKTIFIVDDKTTYSQGLADGERNLFLSKQSYQPGIVVYSKKWFDTLPEDIQKVLLNVPEDLTVWGREQVRKMEPVLLKNLVRYGYEIHDPSPAELQKFKDVEKGVPEAVAKQVGPAGEKLLKAVRAALAK